MRRVLVPPLLSECSLCTIPPCSLNQRSPAAELHSSPWNIAQQAVTADQLIRPCLGASCADDVLDVSVGDRGQRWGAWCDWGPVCCRMKVYVMSEMWGDRHAVAEVELVPKAGTGVPAQTRSEIPTCTVLTVTCSLKYHRTEQNYCCLDVLVSALGSLCWLLILGNSSIWKMVEVNCRGGGWGWRFFWRGALRVKINLETQ